MLDIFIEIQESFIYYPIIGICGGSETGVRHNFIVSNAKN
jgi:hypothetical protein